MNKFEILKSGLQKTKKKLIDGLTEAITGKAVIDKEVIENIEEVLISADIGYDTTEKIITKARENLKKNNGRDESSIKQSIFNELKKILENINGTSVTKNNINEKKPLVYLIIGVNGVGKTTSIGKLAYSFKQEGKKVLLGAADTFRAAAGEQLDIWSKRAGLISYKEKLEQILHLLPIKQLRKLLKMIMILLLLIRQEDYILKII